MMSQTSYGQRHAVESSTVNQRIYRIIMRDFEKIYEIVFGKTFGETECHAIEEPVVEGG